MKTAGASAQRVFYVASVLFAFVLGATLNFGNGYFEQRQESKGVIGDIRNILNQPVSANSGKGIDFSLYNKIQNMIQEKYLRAPVDDKKMFYGALSGMVASLGDPYSTFFDPEAAKAFADELSGSFEGIGAEIGLKNNLLTIIAPLPDSPAEKAGLRAKDIILKIDNVVTDTMTVEEAVSRIRGKGGTTVKLMLVHNGSREPFEVTLTRAAIVFDSVRSRMTPDGYGVVEIFHFNDETPQLFKDAVSKILEKNPKGLVLDLRNNPGGVLEAAVEVAGEWIPNDIIVQEKARTGITNSHIAYGSGRLRNVPTIVLVNGGSASASEILAGALQDYGIAKVVGEQSFGKGTVQELDYLDSQTQIKLTVAEWLTGKGRSIDKSGITPDVKVEMTKEDFNRDRDPQFAKAIELLKKR